MHTFPRHKIAHGAAAIRLGSVWFLRFGIIKMKKTMNKYFGEMEQNSLKSE